VPVFEWIRDERRLLKKKKKKTLVVGLHCPQGGGKTTMCDVLVKLFEAEGARCVVASIDDFYLPHGELASLAARHADNPLLQGRGNPGTHDAQLMRATLEALASPAPLVRVPRYDKAAHDGAGDRRPHAEWLAVEGCPVDVVILEGWCLGFRPVVHNNNNNNNNTTGDEEDDLLAQKKNVSASASALRVVDAFLRADLASVYDLFDAFVALHVRDAGVVYRWREEAEAVRRAAGRGAMTPDEVVAFVDRYMPLYEQYLGPLYATDLVPGHTLHITIDADRAPVDARSSPPPSTP